MGPESDWDIRHRRLAGSSIEMDRFGDLFEARRRHDGYSIGLGAPFEELVVVQ